MNEIFVRSSWNFSFISNYWWIAFRLKFLMDLKNFSLFHWVLFNEMEWCLRSLSWEIYLKRRLGDVRINFQSPWLQISWFFSWSSDFRRVLSFNAFCINIAQFECFILSIYLPTTFAVFSNSIMVFQPQI